MRSGKVRVACFLAGPLSFLIYCLNFFCWLFNNLLIFDEDVLSSHSQEQHMRLKSLFQWWNLCGRRRHLHLHLQRGLGRPHLWPKLVSLFSFAFSFNVLIMPFKANKLCWAVGSQPFKICFKIAFLIYNFSILRSTQND